MKSLLSKMSEKEWTPFYVDLGPFESAIWGIGQKFKADLDNEGDTP